MTYVQYEDIRDDLTSSWRPKVAKLNRIQTENSVSWLHEPSKTSKQFCVLIADKCDFS